MAEARARHILVDDKKFCSELIEQINNGADFADLAKKHSKCPSGQQGGDLGKFGRGVMVPEFETVVFNEEIGKAHGPVKTDFGYHVLEVISRTDH